MKSVYIKGDGLFSVIKTTPEGYERIVKNYGYVKQISKFRYDLIKKLKKLIDIILFPIWILLFYINKFNDIFIEWYEDFVD